MQVIASFVICLVLTSSALARHFTRNDLNIACYNGNLEMVGEIFGALRGSINKVVLSNCLALAQYTGDDSIASIIGSYRKIEPFKKVEIGWPLTVTDSIADALYGNLIEAIEMDSPDFRNHEIVESFLESAVKEYDLVVFSLLLRRKRLYLLSKSQTRSLIESNNVSNPYFDLTLALLNDNMHLMPSQAILSGLFAQVTNLDRFHHLQSLFPNLFIHADQIQILMKSINVDVYNTLPMRQWPVEDLGSFMDITLLDYDWKVGCVRNIFLNPSKDAVDLLNLFREDYGLNADDSVLFDALDDPKSFLEIAKTVTADMMTKVLLPLMKRDSWRIREHLIGNAASFIENVHVGPIILEIVRQENLSIESLIRKYIFDVERMEPVEQTIRRMNLLSETKTLSQWHYYVFDGSLSDPLIWAINNKHFILVEAFMNAIPTEINQIDCSLGLKNDIYAIFQLPPDLLERFTQIYRGFRTSASPFRMLSIYGDCKVYSAFIARFNPVSLTSDYLMSDMYMAELLPMLLKCNQDEWLREVLQFLSVKVAKPLQAWIRKIPVKKQKGHFEHFKEYLCKEVIPRLLSDTSPQVFPSIRRSSLSRRFHKNFRMVFPEEFCEKLYSMNI